MVLNLFRSCLCFRNIKFNENPSNRSRVVPFEWTDGRIWRSYPYGSHHVVLVSKWTTLIQSNTSQVNFNCTSWEHVTPIKNTPNHIRILIPALTTTHGGTRWCSWLRHCATSRKVAGSIPDGVTGIFHRHNPSGRTVVLGSTQPITEMSTGNISWGLKAAGA